MLHKLDREFYPTNRGESLRVVRETSERGEYAPGSSTWIREEGLLLDAEPGREPLAFLPPSVTRPPASVLDELMDKQR